MLADEDFMPEELKKYVVVAGNLSEGFEFHGPFDSFDDAAVFADGMESWISVMWPPAEKHNGRSCQNTD